MKTPDPLLRKVKRQLRHLGVGPGGVVVAVSGGADSVALLRALIALRTPDAAGPVIVAHLNHQLRGEESDADEAFVRALHSRLLTAGATELLMRSERVDVAGLARVRGTNLENTARQVRYDWLVRVAQEMEAAWVATGHTADDQAETLLHRLLRGTGLKGLRGIAPRRSLTAGVELVRPLLSVRRAEVLAFLAEMGQDYRQDSSNFDPRYTRNRIRHELLPLLAERFNPGIVPVLCRLAEQADEAFRGEEELARQLVEAAERPRAGPLLVFDRGLLATAPRHRVREALRLVWQREGWPVDRMGFDGWERLAAVALGEASGVDLPGNIQALPGACSPGGTWLVRWSVNPRPALEEPFA